MENRASKQRFNTCSYFKSCFTKILNKFQQKCYLKVLLEFNRKYLSHFSCSVVILEDQTKF